MNPDLDQLHPYPFQKLGKLLRNGHPPQDREHIALSIGEPKHGAPAFIKETLRARLHELAKYPVTRGGEALRHSIAQWLERRFRLPENSIDPNCNVLPVNGSREALFSFAQCVIDRNERPLVLMPNPFYQIYEGAALLAGAQPYYLNCTKSCAYKPDFDAVPEHVWKCCQLLYICTPSNPTGAVLDEPELQRLIDLAHRHNFVIASDECYSEIYLHEDQPPPGLLGAAMRMGNSDYKRCVAFNSLSKRSNAPGLRSGFVAGDASILTSYLHYRTYHGCAMPHPTQAASAAAWRDESHVHENRRLYREKFDAVVSMLSPTLEVERPAGGFFLWPKTPVDDQQFVRALFEQEHLTLLPGSYLSREVGGCDPGFKHARIALVPPLEECLQAASRINSFLQKSNQNGANP